MQEKDDTSDSLRNKYSIEVGTGILEEGLGGFTSTSDRGNHRRSDLIMCKCNNFIE